MRLSVLSVCSSVAISMTLIVSACCGEDIGADLFQAEIQPLLEANCYDCHGYGMAEGSVTLDEFASPAAATQDPQLWWRVLRMVRAGLMPPHDHGELQSEEIAQLQSWIKSHVFRFDPAQPDPGRVALRRLNRVEYRNTVRDLVGIDYNTAEHFPPEDTGHGFDKIGNVLNISPLHLEKYIGAAKSIAYQVVPLTPGSPEHKKFFGGPIPEEPQQRRELAQQLLKLFATRAYRRPIDNETLERITILAEQIYSQPNRSFEAGIADAYAAILASPRFLFLVEETQSDIQGKIVPLDEYSLASRLSYFLWSTMPDEELFRLAEEGRLREQLPQQIERMIKSPRWSEFVSQFAGQWLRTRDLVHTHVEVDAVLMRERPVDPELARLRGKFWRLLNQPSDKLTPEVRKETAETKRKIDEILKSFLIPHREFYELRQLMKRETEMHFSHVFQKDRPLLELVDCDYAFLNQQLAEHYGIEGVEGKKMRKVQLPERSPRGGILTQGTMLLSTSNPDRTSPVKRGLYILENVLGTPPPPPPPDVPDLEDRRVNNEGNAPTLRQSLERHREDPLCSSCHNRMDPLGLALENFNAIGGFRTQERGQEIDPSGTLITGEQFENVQQLKQILVEKYRLQFYQCLTEKLLTFALGRGLDYNDVQTIDSIVASLEAAGGKPSVLIKSLVESAPFQMRRLSPPASEASSPAHVSQRLRP